MVCYPPPLPPGSLCLFAAYTPDGALPDYTKFYLRNLLECGLTLHVCFSGTEHITADSLTFCTENRIQTYTRPNKGLDFGAWCYLRNHIPTHNVPFIVLANDSVFGPFAPLPPLLQKFKASQKPAWGLVASRAVTPHLQSWFVSLSQQAWQAPAVKRIFHLPFENMSRSEIIWHGELGLSVALTDSGFTPDALWSDLRAPLARFFPANPAHARWRSFLRTGLVPFIKQELLRDNPYHIPALSDWRREILPGNGFNPAWIDAYLAGTPPRTTRTRSNRKGRLLYTMLSEADRYRPRF
ncbi:rhamnan synthesis F family protein [Acetobacter thailandicus]|uniref:Glycosyl transferase n=1 Tax=Acetobacter thailandicus TaxID=1502842 RepID=A0ABT3QE94_9PROT|nr:rhamnan synthesis F family protein [Acetobacter thailandicus]MCX2563591.1 glycosyl transferase [Acetobacter thailandicus]NHN94344.1 glycosyl transferase [Acetobacter thailandicus]